MAPAYWKVRITTNKGKSEWTEPQLFSIGLLGETKWSGTWIGLEDPQPGEQKGMHTRLAARYIRKDFAAKGKVKRAVAYVAGLGVYEFYVNGQRMGAVRLCSLHQPITARPSTTIRSMSLRS